MVCVARQKAQLDVSPFLDLTHTYQTDDWQMYTLILMVKNLTLHHSSGDNFYFFYCIHSRFKIDDAIFIEAFSQAHFVPHNSGRVLRCFTFCDMFHPPLQFSLKGMYLY
jgi:hypothetical protein